MENTSGLSFEQTLEQNKESIYRICKVYAVSPVEPEDLFQEVVIHLWKAFSSFQNKSSISTWVYRVALNVCIRAKSKLDKGNRNFVCFESIQFQIPGDAQDSQMLEKLNSLHECIRLLNEEERSIVVLVLEGLRYRDIAEITGLTENYIAVKMKRLKKTLLKCINSKMSGE